MRSADDIAFEMRRAKRKGGETYRYAIRVLESVYYQQYVSNGNCVDEDLTDLVCLLTSFVSDVFGVDEKHVSKDLRLAMDFRSAVVKEGLAEISPDEKPRIKSILREACGFRPTSYQEANDVLERAGYPRTNPYVIDDLLLPDSVGN